MSQESAVMQYNLREHTLGQMLGQGGYGAVLLAHPNENPNFKFAVKEMSPMNKADRKKIQLEIDIHRQLTQLGTKYFIDFLGFDEEISEERGWSVSMFMEFAPNKSVKYLIDTAEVELTSEFAHRLFRELMSAVNFMHQHNYIHGDIKPDNMLLDKDQHLKLADFGSSRVQIGDQKAKASEISFSGDYGAPELLSLGKVNGRCTDVFAAGVTFFEMLTGTRPWKRAYNGDSEFQDWKSGKTDTNQAKWSTLSEQEVIFFRHVLTAESKRRPSAQWMLDFSFTEPTAPIPSSSSSQPVAEVATSVQQKKGRKRRAHDETPIDTPDVSVEPKQETQPKLQKENDDPITEQQA